MTEPSSPDLPEKLDYEKARELAADSDVRVRRALAAREDVPPEVLYYLAEDAETSVREAVAANPLCPAKGNLVLADDPDVSVRVALAAKIGRGEIRRAEGWKGGVAANGAVDTLSRDRIAKVRAIIAEALKNLTDADPTVVNRLARDAEIVVAAPILEFSPVLTDGDLLDIIAGNPQKGALSAIARRSYVGEAVAGAIVAANDSLAITHLLRNGNAHLQESVLDLLIERCVDEPTWQEPLVYRPELNTRLAVRLAELVAVHLLDRILARKDLSPDAVREVAKVVGERIRQQEELNRTVAPPGDQSLADRYGALIEQARIGHTQGKLDEISLMVSLFTDKRDEIVAALVVRAGLPLQSVLDMIEAQSPRAVSALAWAAGLSATFAFEMQMRLAGLPLAKVMKPGLDGSYVLKESDMRWQLAMFCGEEV